MADQEAMCEEAGDVNENLIKYSGLIAGLAHAMGKNLDAIWKRDFFGAALKETFIQIFDSKYNPVEDNRPPYDVSPCDDLCAQLFPPKQRDPNELQDADGKYGENDIYNFWVRSPGRDGVSPLTRNQIMKIGRDIGGFSRSWIDMLKNIQEPVYDELDIEDLYVEYMQSKCKTGEQVEYPFNIIKYAKKIGGDDSRWLKNVEKYRDDLLTRKDVHELYDDYLKKPQLPSFKEEDMDRYSLTGPDFTINENRSSQNPFDFGCSDVTFDTNLSHHHQSRERYQPRRIFERVASPPAHDQPAELFNFDLRRYFDEKPILTNPQITEIATQVAGNCDPNWIAYVHEMLYKPAFNPDAIANLYRHYLKHETRRQQKLAEGYDPRLDRERNVLLSPR